MTSIDPSLKKLLREEIRMILTEVLFGKALDLDVEGQRVKGLISKNTRPGELPYRMTIFDKNENGSLKPVEHIDISEEEANLIISKNILSPRIKSAYEGFISIIVKKEDPSVLHPV